MLVCIPSNHGTGLEDVVCDHFGSAAFFTIYNSDTDKIDVISNRNQHHGHGACRPLGQLKPYGVDAVVCNGIGRRAVDMLAEAGVTVYVCQVKTVKDTIEKVKAKDLVPFDPDTACGLHGHHTGQGQGLGQHRHGRDD